MESSILKYGKKVNKQNKNEPPLDIWRKNDEFYCLNMIGTKNNSGGDS